MARLEAKGYKLLSELGRGKFGVVWKAVDENDPTRFVAIKFVQKPAVNDPKAPRKLKLLSTETKALERLDHRNIVRLYEVQETDQLQVYIMEVADGGSLFDHIVKLRYFPDHVARHYFIQLIRAIEYCHSQLVAHRDLKPENLLLDSRGVLKVSDFGWAHVADTENKVMSTYSGTAHYMAPEVLTHQNYSYSADLWSAGVVLFTMVCGYLPFDDDDQARLQQKICHGGSYLRYPNWARADAVDLIKKLLNPDVNARFKISDVYNHHWIRDDPSMRSPRQSLNQTSPSAPRPAAPPPPAMSEAPKELQQTNSTAVPLETGLNIRQIVEVLEKLQIFNSAGRRSTDTDLWKGSVFGESEINFRIQLVPQKNGKTHLFVTRISGPLLHFRAVYLALEMHLYEKEFGRPLSNSSLIQMYMDAQNETGADMPLVKFLINPPVEH